MKKLCSFLSLLMLSIQSASAQKLQWLAGTEMTMGKSNGYTSSCINITDAQGNTYIFGDFYGYLDFKSAEGSASISISSPSIWTFYLTKYNKEGKCLWVKSLESSVGGGKSHAISFDRNGNLLVSGIMSGTTDFDPSPGITSITTKYRDVFLANYDISGNLLWVKSMESPNLGATDALYLADIAVNANTIYVTGYYRGTIDFDMDSPVYPLTAKGSEEAFIAAYSNTGKLLWVKNLEGFSSKSKSWGLDLTFDKTGFMYLTGVIANDSVDLDPGTGSNRLKALSSSDFFLAKYDSTGKFIWGKNIIDSLASTIGGMVYGYPNYSINETGPNIVIDSHGDIIYYGGIGIKAYIGKEEMGHDRISNGVFIAKFKSVDGKPVWAKDFNGSSVPKTYCDAEASGLCLDKDDNIFITGHFRGMVDVDPSPTDSVFINSPYIAGLEFFIVSYSSTGKYRWVNRSYMNYGPSSNVLFGSSLCIDKEGYLYTTGKIAGAYSVKFDTVSGAATLDEEDLFIAKYKNDIPASITEQKTAIINWKVYPNPSKETLNIINAESGSTVVLYDISGKLILQAFLTAGKNQVDISKYAAGNYVLEITDPANHKGYARITKE